LAESLRVAVEQDPTEGDDGIGAVAGWIGHEEAQILRQLGRGEGGDDALVGGRDEVAILVLQESCFQAQLAGEFEPDVTDGADRGLNQRGDAFVAFAAHGGAGPV